MCDFNIATLMADFLFIIVQPVVWFLKLSVCLFSKENLGG